MDDERTTSTVSVPERYESAFSSGDSVSTETKAEVLAEMDRQHDPLLQKDDIAPNVSVKERQVSRALKELRSDDIVIELGKTKQNLYYLNHEESEYPLPPDVQTGEELLKLNIAEFLKLENPMQVRITAFGIVLGANLLIGLGLLLAIIGGENYGEPLLTAGFVDLGLAFSLLGLLAIVQKAGILVKKMG